MININDLNWLAGIIDGEGALLFNKRNGIHATRNGGKGQFSFVTRIQVGSTDMGIIKRVSEIWFELGSKFYYQLHNPEKRFKNAKRYLTIDCEGYRSVRKILEAITDKLHSHQKQLQAKKMLEYIDYRLGMIQQRKEHGRLTSKIGENQFETVDKKMVEEFIKLKHFQISPPTTIRKASSPLTWPGIDDIVCSS